MRGHSCAELLKHSADTYSLVQLKRNSKTAVTLLVIFQLYDVIFILLPAGVEDKHNLRSLSFTDTFDRN